MIGIVMPDIPRIYSAIAYWAACLIYISLLRKRNSKRYTLLLSITSLLLISLFMVLTANVHIILFIPVMIIVVLIMIGYIYVCCDVSYKDAVYFGIQAFIVGEFMASIEWQIYNYYWTGREMNNIIIEILHIVLIYGSICLLIWYILKERVPFSKRLDITNNELISTIIIVILVFAVSNLGFVTKRTPFSGQYPYEIANIRTLVDLGGIALLYAHLIQCNEIRVRNELEAVENVLDNQYVQYKQSKESIDLINYKYHDLKHQINVLRMEEDPRRCSEFLDKMENEIKVYEYQNKTGNKVLDIILTSKSMYCNKNGIKLTCVVDGKLIDFMDARDIASIFGNALDNAIESLEEIEDEEKRLIHVTVSQQKEFLIIRIENYYEGKLKYQDDNLLTTKKNKEFHGYGIKSIKHIADKYNGGVSIDTDNNWFDLKVLIPLNKM